MHGLRRLRFWFVFLLVLTVQLNQQGSVWADVLTLDRALEQAVESSYDYKISKITTGISKTDIRSARADYFPQIKGYSTLERLKGLGDQAGGYAVVGNNVLPAGSRFQNSGGLQLNQVLWDFGQRHQKVKIAKTDVQSKAFQSEQLLRDLKLKVIETYTDALLTYQALHTKMLIVPLYKQLFKMDERLHEAGYLSKVQLSEDAIQLAKALNDQQELQNKLQEQLQTLSEYTHMSYSADDLELSELDSDDDGNSQPMVWKAEDSVEAKVYTLEIDKKRHEVSMLKRQYLPQLSGYTYYNLYGSSYTGISQAVQNLQSRSWTAGVSLNIPIFDGLKLQSQIEKAKLETERLKMEREKKLFELAKKEERLRLQSASADQLLVTKKGWVEQVQDKLVMMQRLADEQMVDKTKVLKDTIQQIETDFEQYKVEVQKAAAVKKLAVLYTG